MNKNNVIPGPMTVIVSATTIGHTEEGATFESVQSFKKTFSHEGGPNCPISIKPDGARSAMLTVSALEISAANLALVMSDITTSGTRTSIKGNKTNTALKSFTNVKGVAINDSGTTITVVIQNAKAYSPRLLGRGKKGENWLVEMVFEGEYVDTGSIAYFSGLD